MLINISKINLNPNSGGGKPIELESKEITITENGTTIVTPSEGFGGMLSVDITTDVPTPRVEANKSISITENGSYSVTPSDGYVGVGDVDISVFVSEVGTSIDFGEIGYNATDNANANMIIQDGINYAKQIQAEYTDSKTYKGDGKIVYFPYVDTSNRTTCVDLFYGCSSMQVVPPLTISNKCTSMGTMFYRCGALKNIDTTNWDLSNVTSINNMFNYCSALNEIIGIENWDVSKVDYVSNVFNECTSLENINLSGWDISGVTNKSNINQFFNNCPNLKNVNISGWDFSNFTDMPGNFFNGSNNIETINITNCNFSTFTKFDYFIFKGKTKLKNIIGIENLDTSNATTLKGLFSSCNSLSNIDVSNFKTENVTDIRALFYGCRAITELDLSNWDTSNLINLSSNTMSDYPFYDMENLQKINLSNWDVSKCTNFYSLFKQCYSLTEIIGIENWNTSNVTSFNEAFYKCSSLIDLNLSGWDVGKSINLTWMFFDCTSLTNFQAPKNINAKMDFYNSRNLTVNSLLSILNNLTDRTSTTSMECRLGNANLAKLTAEQKAIATSKNWVLTS